MSKPKITANLVVGKKGAKTQPKKPRLPAAHPKSAEFVVDSEDDDERPAETLKATQADSDISVSSDESEDDSKEGSRKVTKETLQNQSKKPVQNGTIKSQGAFTTAKTVEASTDEDSSSEDSDTGSDSDEVQEVNGTGQDQVNGAAEQDDARMITVDVEVHTSAPRPVLPFKPPPGFTEMTLGSTSSTTSHLQSAISNGQQIWHIAAPQGVPLSSIKELALKNITDGSSILTHKNTNYAFSASALPESSDAQVLLPSSDGYKPAAATVSRTLQLQQVVKLPHASNQQSSQTNGTAAAGTSYVPTLKRKREQPHGLRQRFLPIGVIAQSMSKIETVVDGDRAEADEGMPDDDQEMADTQQESAAASGLPSVQNGDAATSRTKKDKKRKHEDETLEERAARKAAKRAKKEAKAAALERSHAPAKADGVKAKKKKKAEAAVDGD